MALTTATSHLDRDVPGLPKLMSKVSDTFVGLRKVLDTVVKSRIPNLMISIAM